MAHWGHLVAGWQPAGLGTAAPATPAFGVAGVLGTVLVGAMGLTQKVLVLGCVPVGAWGVARFLRPLCSPRARLVAAGVLPRPPAGLQRGRPGPLGRPGGLRRRAVDPAPTGPGPPASPPSSTNSSPDEPPPPAWRATPGGQMLVLGVLEAVAVAFAPAVAPMVVLCALGIVVGSYVVGQADGALRALWVALGATVVAAVVSAPWVLGTLAAGHGALSVFGLAGSAVNQPGCGGAGALRRGPHGDTVLSWLLVAAALLPLLIGRQARLAGPGGCGRWPAWPGSWPWR